MKLNKIIVLRMVFAVLVPCVFLFSCEKKEKSVKKEKVPVVYVDGTYSAVSEIKDDWGGYAEIKVVIKDGKIAECEFLGYEKNGMLKDENYGKVDGVIKNAGLYAITQNSVKQAALYGMKLVETQSVEEVDVLSGATVSYALFKNAAEIALKKAESGEK